MQTMPISVLEPQTEQRVVNDFAINVATANGSGSQTSNLTIIRSLFKMGIPVNGKNLFPSNIKGLPTWYIVRVSEEGYVARREQSEILIAMNQQTVVEDHDTLIPGGVCFYNEALKFEPNRDDVVYYPMPVKALTKGVKVPPALRNYIANMVYVGVLAQVIGIDLEKVEEALSDHFKGKEKPIALNMEVVRNGFSWAEENVTKQDHYFVEPMNSTAGKIMLDGNSAAALGAVFGGVTFAAWYPITPSTSLIDGLNGYLPRLRRDPETGEPTYCVAQAEDELAAIGMIIGAGWAGARAMTSTSGPGISLMSEFAGLGYFAEIPAVIWNVVRMGPSTGLPTRVSQGDLISTYNLGHGDSKQICLLPSSIEECFEFGYKAFDVAEEAQAPVFVLSDLDLGMNLWMGEQFEYPSEPMKRGKVLSAKELDEIEDYGRYKDVDGDGIPYRTVPGTPHLKAAYFTRGTGHNEYAEYSERSDDWVNNLDRLALKFETIKSIVPAPAVDMNGKASIGIISYGSSDPAVVEARARLRKVDVETSYLRVKALPMNGDVLAFIEAHDRVYIVENNYNGQLAEILRSELPQVSTKLTSLSQCDGLPLTARWIAESLQAEEQN
ncbi:MAG: 2-oxoacid:acceptor oxidoreductase subunit alpha [Chloroflexota bacterium]